MIAKLFIREVGAREFTSFNGNYVDEDARTATEAANLEGERLCNEGNVEAYQVWELVTTKQRVWKLEEVA